MTEPKMSRALFAPQIIISYKPLRDAYKYTLKDRQSKRNVLCAIIEFRNSKGRPESANR